MYSKSQLVLKWFQYFSLASNSRGHGVHSPFVYQLIREVFNDDRDYYAYKLIETVRKNLVQDQRVLWVQEMGAGSNQRSGLKKNVGEICRTAVSEQKFGRLLFRLAKFYKARHIIEMGSSLGISTSYLASADAGTKVITMEGSSAIAGIAKETFEKLKLSNISQTTGDFQNHISAVIGLNPPSDLVFIDGNHRKRAVLEYFEKFINKMADESLIIIHDIHWSREMEEAWDMIQNHPQVKMTIDIFSAGLIFFRNEFQVKQKFIIRF